MGAQLRPRNLRQFRRWSVTMESRSVSATGSWPSRAVAQLYFWYLFRPFRTTTGCVRHLKRCCKAFSFSVAPGVACALNIVSSDTPEVTVEVAFKWPQAPVSSAHPIGRDRKGWRIKSRPPVSKYRRDRKLCRYIPASARVLSRSTSCLRGRTFSAHHQGHGRLAYGDLCPHHAGHSHTRLISRQRCFCRAACN